jgi:hypothetical protein
MIPHLDHPNGHLFEFPDQLAALAAAAAADQPAPPEPAPPPKAPKPGRTADGKFAPGNRGGPGNPFARKVASFREALYEAVTRDMLKDLASRLWGMAIGGNVAAARLLLQYLVGKPQDPPNPDRLAHDEWQTYQSEAVGPDEMKRLMGSCPADMANGWADGVWPVLADCTIRQPFLEMLRHDREQREAAAERAKGKKSRQPPQTAPTPNGDNGHSTAPQATAPPTSAEAAGAAAPVTPPPQERTPDAAAPESGRHQTARSATTRQSRRPEPRARPASRRAEGAHGETATGRVSPGDCLGAPSTNGDRGGAAGPPFDQHEAGSVRPDGECPAVGRQRQPRRP